MIEKFNKNQKEFNIRYARQIAIPEIGSSGQRKIASAKVLVIGCGALGSMVAMQLAGAGVGYLGIADYDNIEVSNLQRQFFFLSSQAGKPKAVILSEKITGLNPEVIVKVHNILITQKIAFDIFPDYDFIVDATDNPDSKTMIDAVSGELHKPCCIGGVRDFSGQVITLLPDDMRFNEIFGETGSGAFMPCSLGGVAGPAAALCASIQAAEVLKYITGAGELLSGKLLTFNMQTNSYNIFTL